MQRMHRMHRQTRTRWLIAQGGVGLLLVVGLGVAAFQPRVANAFGYALPGPHGLPYRIHVLGRDYQNPSQCAGADWCANVAPQSTCWSSAKLTGDSMWPLRQVGAIITLLGPTQTVLAPPIPAGMTSTLLFVARGDCYLVFALEGGP